MEKCDPQYNIEVPVLGYTVSANGFTMTLDSPISGSGNLLFSGSDITAPGNLHVVNAVNTMTGETRIFSAQLQVSSATNPLRGLFFSSCYDQVEIQHLASAPSLSSL